MKALSTLALIFALLTFGAFRAFPQAETGQIIGTVTDPSGALIPSAQVTVKSVATGAERTGTSSDAGAVTFTNLQPDVYEVSVTAPGFSTLRQQVTVTVGSKLGLDLKLEVGKAETVVEVAGVSAAIAVNTETQTITQVLSTQQLLELPTLTRNPYSLVVTSGNVSEDDPSGRGAGVAINGLRAASTNILLDGVANNDEFGASVGQTVPLDSVQEMGIITNNFTAEYGRASGGVINVTTKSGTNQFHGTVYEFNRVSDLASNTFNNNANGLDKPIFVRNQFGYSLGGPVKKNKLFFFSSTEWTRVRSAANVIAIVPDAQLIAAASPATQSIFSTYGKLASGANILGTFSRNQLTALGTDPCSGGSATGGCASYNPNAPMFDLIGYNVPANSGAGVPQNAYSTVQRVDYNLSDKTSIYARYALYSEVDQSGSVYNSPYAGYNSGQTNFDNSLIVSMTHTFSPRFVSESKLDFNRFNSVQPISSNGLVPNYFLANANVGSSIGPYSVALPGQTPYSPGEGVPFGGPQNFGEAYQDFSYTVGKHQLRFGGDVEYLRDNRTFGAYTQASEVFGNSTGLGLDNLLAGQIYEYEGAINPQGKFPCVNGVQTAACTVTLPVGPPTAERSNRYHEGAAYFQDSWKIAKRLTLQLGLRWEYFGVQHNVNPNLDSNFYAAGGAYYGPGEFVGIENGQVDTTPNSPIGELWKPSWHNFAPRVGFAWDIFGDGKTAFRGGYGIGYERNFGNVTYNVLFNPPAYAVVDVISGTNGFGTIPATVSNAGPLSGSSGALPLPPSELRYVQPNIPQAYAHLMSASLEHQFGNSMHLELDYSGSIGENQYDIAYMNFPGQGNAYLGIPCTPGDCEDVLNTQYGLINRRGAAGHSNYNAMNVRYDIQNIKNSGLTLRLNYTWSHAMDDLSDTFSSSYNQFNLGYTDLVHPNVDYGNAEFDNRHRIAVSAIYAPPYFNHLKGPGKYLLGGWEFAPVFTARTGAPYSIYDLTGDNFIYTRVATDEVVPVNGNEFQSAGANTYNIYNFSNIPTNVYINPKYGDSDFGPYPANMTGRDYFHTPGSYNLDVGAYKSLRFTERMSLQLRLEAYNVFNHSNLYVNTGSAYIYGGAGNITASYGGSNGTYLENRNVQIGAKFIF